MIDAVCRDERISVYLGRPALDSPRNGFTQAHVSVCPRPPAMTTRSSPRGGDKLPDMSLQIDSAARRNLSMSRRLAKLCIITSTILNVDLLSDPPPASYRAPTMRDGGYLSSLDGLVIRDMQVLHLGGECIRLRGKDVRVVCARPFLGQRV